MVITHTRPGSPGHSGAKGMIEPPAALVLGCNSGSGWGDGSDGDGNGMGWGDGYGNGDGTQGLDYDDRLNG